MVIVFLDAAVTDIAFPAINADFSVVSRAGLSSANATFSFATVRLLLFGAALFAIILAVVLFLTGVWQAKCSLVPPAPSVRKRTFLPGREGLIRGSWAEACWETVVWSAAVLGPELPGRSKVANGSPVTRSW